MNAHKRQFTGLIFRRVIFAVLGCALGFSSFSGGKDDALAVTKLPEEIGAISLKVIDGAVWVGTSAGLYRESGNGLQRIGAFDKAVWQILPINGQIWLITTGGVARVDNGRVTPVAMPPLDVQSIIP